MRRQWHEYTVQVGEDILTFQQIRFSEVNTTTGGREQAMPHCQRKRYNGDPNTQYRVWALVDEIFVSGVGCGEVRDWVRSPHVEQIISTSSCKRSEIACLIRTAIQTRFVFDQFKAQRRKDYRILEQVRQHLLSAVGTILLP